MCRAIGACEWCVVRPDVYGNVFLFFPVCIQKQIYVLVLMRTIHLFDIFFPDGKLTFYSKSKLVGFRNRLYEAEDGYGSSSLASANLATAVSRRANVFMLPFFFDHAAIIKCTVRWAAGASFEGFVFFLDTRARVRGELVSQGLHVLLVRLQRWFRRVIRVRQKQTQDAALAFAMSGHVRLGDGSCAGGLGDDVLGAVLKEFLRVK